jgi:hypothetical protein
MASAPVKGMSATQKDKAREALLEKISGTLATTFQTNLYEFSDEANKTFNNVTSGSINFRSEYGFTAGAAIVIDKNLRDERKQSVRDPILSISIPIIGANVQTDIENLKDSNAQKDNKKIKNKYKKTKTKSKKQTAKAKKDKNKKKTAKKKTTSSGGTFTLSLRSSLALPFSDRSKKETNLRTAVSLSPVAVYSVDPNYIPGLILIFRPGVRVYSHEFKVDTSGRSNTSYSMNARFIISYSIIDNLSISFDNIYARAWTYDSNYNDQFSFDQSLSYSFMKGFSVYAGHAIGGSALDVNGQDSNLKAFDSRESEVYTGISYRF